MRLVYFCLIVLSLSILGCRGELTQVPGNVELEIALGESGLEVLSVESVGNLPNPPAGRHAIAYVFKPDDGGEVVEGLAPDPRVLRSEFDRAGQPHPQEVIAPIGIFEVRVPATPGVLLLRDANGETLGEVHVDPRVAGLKNRSQALMRPDDVLGPVTKVVDHGTTSEKADILFLPDGYTEGQMADFHAHVDSIVSILREQSGYREHWAGFNIWRQDVRSRNVGTGTWGRPIDTAFETAYGVSGVQRCIFFAGTAGQQAARGLAAAANADVTVVLVNSTETGGCASGKFVVTSRPRHVADTVAHELGHALFGLADEYEYAGSGASCDIGPNVSASSSRSQLPWADMVNTDQLPTSPNASFGTIGAFEGGGYCTRGRYRPAHNCMMRTLGASMCPVCKREVARTMAALAPGSGSEAGGASGPDGAGSTVTADEVTVTNATSSDLWVRCDSAPSITCSNWTFIPDGAVGTVKSPGRRLVLHTASAPAPVTFELRSVTAPGASVTVYPNLQNPFVPAGQSGGSGSESSGSALSATGLSPDFDQVIGAETLFSWNAVPGATSYRIEIEWEDSNRSWHPLTQFDEPYNSVELLFSDWGRYRWRVIVCGEAGCFASRDAIFNVQLNATPDPEPAAEPLSAPTGLQPAHEAVVSDVQLSWNADIAATSYNVSVRGWDDATSTWVEVAGESTSEPRYTMPESEPQTWYAWTVQSCDGVCSAWTEYSLLYVSE